MKNFLCGACVRHAVTLVTLIGIHSSNVFAQTRKYAVEIGAGVVRPTGVLGRDRGAGPLVRVGVQRAVAEKPVAFRLDVEGLWLGRQSTDSPTVLGALGGLGIVESVIVGPRTQAVAPYALLGIGLHKFFDRTPDSYSATLLGGRLGAGVRGRVAGLRISAEVAANFGLYSNYGGVKSSKVGAYWPITVGIGF